jgi:hypothetical protein
VYGGGRLPSTGSLRYKTEMSSRALLALLLLALVGSSAAGCAHAPPVRPWERGYLAKRSMRFDDGLEGRFRQHLFGAREGADGGYGVVGGGCGCN